MSTDDCELSTYSQMTEVIENLALLVREKRRATRLSLRSAAVQIGTNASTLSRLENGKDISIENLVAILHWLDWAQPALSEEEFRAKVVEALDEVEGS